MASSYAGKRVSGAAATVHEGSGWLLALLVNHGQGTAQTVTLYDNTADAGPVLLTLTLPANAQPVYLEFLHPIPFSTGLRVAPASADVNVWAKGR